MIEEYTLKNLPKGEKDDYCEKNILSKGNEEEFCFE